MKNYFLTPGLFILISFSLYSQDIPEEGAFIDTINTSVDLFNEEDPMDITLTLDLKEYLAYKIYNILSPVSFRVRLIRMKYVDTGRKGKMTESWAFMIEPEGLLAGRLEAIPIKNDELSMARMEKGSMDLVAMFMFMIGNSDYSIVGRHNVMKLYLVLPFAINIIPLVPSNQRS